MIDEQRRRAYLRAMDIPLWLARETTPPEPPAATVDPAAEAPPTQPAAPQPVPEPLQAPQPDLDWDGLAAAVADCQACPELVRNRSRTVFGVGNRQADLMVIGEAPGVDEDRQGEPFVGRAGQLLDLMLQAVGLPREQVFIANVLKCRPPNNRDPHTEEAQRCEAFLLRQLDLVAPRLILSVGRISAHNLLKTDEAVGRLRGRVHYFGERRIPLVVTYHPAYLLRSPEQKARAWDDLQLAWRTLQQPVNPG
jgi:uracil-DNA glycosylase family 4